MNKKILNYFSHCGRLKYSVKLVTNPHEAGHLTDSINMALVKCSHAHSPACYIGWFHATMAKVSSSDEDHITCKPRGLPALR
jgi:hypothetical protein